MDYTTQDLEENLRKMVAVGDLLRAACDEVQGLLQSGGSEAQVPGSVRNKLRTALAFFDEVNRFMSALRP